MANEIAKLFVAIGLNDSDLQKGLKDLQRNLVAAGKLMTGLGAAISVPLGLAVKNFAETGSAIYEMSQKTGFSTEALSELKYAAEQSGTSLGGLQAGIRTMSNVITDASKGMGAAQNTLMALGLSFTDLAGKTPEEQFRILSEALAGIEDPTTRAALAQDIFGKSGMDLLPMLADGTEGMAKLRQEARDLGLVMDEESAAKADEFGDAMTKLKGGLQGIGNTIASNLIPALMPLIETVQKVLAGVMEWAKEHPELAKVILIVVAAVGGLMAILGPILIMLPMLAAGFTLMLGPVGLIILAVVALAAVATLVMLNWDKIKGFFANLWEGIKNTFKNAINFLIGLPEAWVNVYVKAINYIIGALNSIHFEMPDWVPGIGGKGIGINIPLVPELNLPRLALGGIAMGPTLAMIGERGPEAVVPLSRMGGAGGMVVNITVQGDVIAERDFIEKVRQVFYEIRRNNVSLGMG